MYEKVVRRETYTTQLLSYTLKKEEEKLRALRVVNARRAE